MDIDCAWAERGWRRQEGKHQNELLRLFAASGEILCLQLCYKVPQALCTSTLLPSRPASYQVRFQGCLQLCCRLARPSTPRMARHTAENRSFNLSLLKRTIGSSRPQEPSQSPEHRRLVFLLSLKNQRCAALQCSRTQ